MQTWLMISNQDSNSNIMEHLVFSMDQSMSVIMMIISIISMSMLMIIPNRFPERMSCDYQDLENFWTLTPILMLWAIAMPTIKTLYISEDAHFPTLTFKAIGHQWYWSYEFSTSIYGSELTSYELDCYMIPNSFIRMLESDNHLILPCSSLIRALITSEDVLHSWALPSLGLKMDAVPGRINQLYFNIKRPGIMFGQCSELCGAGHSFMPITISSVPLMEYNQPIN